MDPVLGRIYYAADGAGGSGGDADAGGNRGSGDGNPETKAGDTIPKAEVDKIVKARLERERAKYSDYEETKQRLAELDAQLAERQKQDLESKGKYDEALETTKQRYQAELEKAASEREQWQQRYETMAIDNAVIVAAQHLNALDPNDVLALVRNKVKLGADGIPSFDDGKSIEDGVKAFLDAKPHLVKATSRGGSGTNHSPSGGNAAAGGGNGRSRWSEELLSKPLAQLTPEERQQLGGAGMIERARRKNATPWAQPRGS